MKRQRETSMFPGAFLGMALVALTSGPVINSGWWDVPCWFYDFSFCAKPVKDPKGLVPDTPTVGCTGEPWCEGQ